MKLQKIKTSKNKKGILLPETLKLLIGVLCIVLLIYLAVKMYGIFAAKSELEMAKAGLADIIGKINATMEDAKAKNSAFSLEYMLFTPQGWALTAWPIKAGEKTVPSACSIKGWTNCMCFCEAVYAGGKGTTTTIYSGTFEKCNGGVCLELNNRPADFSIISTVSAQEEFGSLVPIRVRKLGTYQTGGGGGYTGLINITYIPDKDKLLIEDIGIKK